MNKILFDNTEVKAIYFNLKGEGYDSEDDIINGREIRQSSLYICEKDNKPSIEFHDTFNMKPTIEYDRGFHWKNFGGEDFINVSLKGDFFIISNFVGSDVKLRRLYLLNKDNVISCDVTV